MSISPISSNIINLLSEEPVTAKATGVSAAESFSNIFDAAFNNVEVNDALDKNSAIELVTGQADDLSGLLLDAEKAEMALSLALQLRNKALDAYNEIMRMSV